MQIPRLPHTVRPASLVLLYVALTALFSAPWTTLLLHTQHLDMGCGFVIHTLMW